MNLTKGVDAFHLLPVCKLGRSGSYYAIADQLQVSPELEGVSWADLKEFAQHSGHKLIVDVVLNHTANDSPWLVEPQYQNALYTETTVPNLKTAIMWDQKAQEFS